MRHSRLEELIVRWTRKQLAVEQVNELLRQLVKQRERPIRELARRATGERAATAAGRGSDRRNRNRGMARYQNVVARRW